MARTFAGELAALEQAALRRRLRIVDSPQQPRLQSGGRQLINFSSNDYLGLAASAELSALLKDGVDRCGAGSGASRLVCGTHRAHAQLEDAIAAFKGTESALAFSSGYAAAVGTLTAIAEKGDILLMDKLCHASLIDGARLSGATLRVFPHNRTDRLAELLVWARENAAADRRIIIVTESVFSMDGDLAPLAEIVRLRHEHDALLMVDEAHAVGIMGPGGRGLAAELGLSGSVDIHLGTLSKALGLHGGYIAGSRALTDLLVNRARSFIYSTAPPPSVAWAATRVVQDIIASAQGDAARARLQENIRLFTAPGTDPATNAGPAAPGPAAPSPAAQSAILPVIIGGEQAALDRSAALERAGFLVPAIRFPTVAKGSARLRVTLSATHTAEEIRGLRGALESAASPERRARTER